ncbi:MAG TPA: transglutaminase-like domain-containing protein [Telluria sp.]|jgi:transglutaminase-like putative cysteine protease
MQRRQFLAGGAVLGALCVLPAPAACGAQDALVRRIRFVMTFNNPTPALLTGQMFWGYLPAQALPRQRLQAVQVSMPHSVREDALGHRILELAFAPFPGLGQQVVTVTAEVQLGAAPAAQAAAGPGKGWQGAERYIESDAPAIVALAATLRRPQAVDSARAIYDWVRANLQYAGYVADDHGALDALSSGRGDCTEYANLVVALARAAGLPARMVGGYVLDRDSAPRPSDYHNWAEVYLDGDWRLLDAQKEHWFEPAEQYLAFRYYRDQSINPVGLAHRYRLQGQLQVRL